MSPSDLTPTVGRIHDAWDRLHQAFDATEVAWRDGRRDEFRRAHLDPLQPAHARLLDAISRMSQVLLRVRAECVDTLRH